MLCDPRRHAPILVKIINQHPYWRKGAEIGVAQGRTSFAILSGCPHVSLIAIEPFRYIEDSEHSGLYRDFDFAANEAKVEAVRKRFAKRMIVMKMTSLEAAEKIADASLDFVFIDANHMYEEVRADILAWRPKVKSGGAIMGHDYRNRWPGVVRAVDEIFDGPSVYPESIWAVAA